MEKIATNDIVLTKKFKKFFLIRFFLDHPLFYLYLSFQTNITILKTNRCEKMLCPSSIRCQDSNPQPSKHECPPITSRPWLPH